MRVLVYEEPVSLGKAAAKLAREQICEAISKRGYARIIVATGRSQFEMLEALVEEKIDWEKVDVFHLDEYVGLSATHKASFRRYLDERLVQTVHPRKMHFVDGEGDFEKNLEALSAELNRESIDVAFVGIGENGHLAFNDPPCDFDNEEAYLVVTLDEKCKMQQVREGWFEQIEDVPTQAITMSIQQIMKSHSILACVPLKVKAQAVKDTLTQKVSNLFPASILREHQDCTLFLDSDSASLLDPETIGKEIASFNQN